MKSKKTVSIMMICGLILSTALLTACGDSGSKRRTGIRSARDNQNNTGTLNPGVVQNASVWPGQIYSSNQAGFQSATAAFLTSFMDPSTLGTVSAQMNQSTGARFRGSMNITISGTTFNSGSGGALDLFIVDDKAASGAESPIAIGQIPLSGYTPMGNQATLTFADSYGQVVLQGYLSGSGNNRVFYGQIWFANSRNVTGGANQSWNWGAFAIYACQFFRCM